MTIGYCYVVADILHGGHILFLQNCKSLCDRLICGVLTEAAVLEKKTKKPVLSLDERMTLVRPYADAVVAQDEYSPTKNCKLIMPDILFESDNHATWGDNGGRRVTGIPYYPNQSSMRIKRRVRNE